MAEINNNGPVYGRNAVDELLKSGASADTVFISESLDEKSAGYFTALAKQSGAVVKRTKNEKLDELCGKARHQGVAAFAAEVEYSSIEDILDLASQNGEAPFLLIADGIEDPHNLGALMRSALLCGVHGIIIPKRGAAGITPTVLKSSAGAAARLPVARVANIGESVRKLKKANVFVYCAAMDGAPLEKSNLSGPVALVMGSEGGGVSPLVKKLCDGSVSISMSDKAGGVDSFNVSVAGGIIMYDIFKKRSAL